MPKYCSKRCVISRGDPELYPGCGTHRPSDGWLKDQTAYVADSVSVQPLRPDGGDYDFQMSCS